ncbi:hypothetical protein ACWCQ1_51560 [Streptomyces sp. NPDC002144]|jgi:hypothetical protein|uniref:hypothetical protein n=1 Tax=Bacilli TaxID=91061 RepID=UPI0020415B9E|nr:MULTISPECIES: hypothetical protein [Bacilli]MCM3032951.1 hypothetical protein [Niallia sp. MER 6]MDK8746841.1 hypothetical protein [Streptococcus agalactiae]
MTEKSTRNLHDPKSYRIYRLYKILFESCVDVFGKRTGLSDALINRLFESNEIEELPTYTKAILVEKMLDELQNINKPKSELIESLSSPRMKLVKQTMIDNGLEWDGVREYIHFRILPNYRDFIQTYADDTLGEVIELAIANFINNRTDFEFNLIEISFSYNVLSVKNK